MGGLSQLLEDIIHHILSYLETKEAARVSIICKTWYTAWLTCPTLTWYTNPICGPNMLFNLPSYSISSSNSFQLMIRIFRRYRNNKIHIQQLNLWLKIFDPCSLLRVDQWIIIAVQNGVKRLRLKFWLDYNDGGYIFPAAIFEAKLLTELSIKGIGVSLNNQVSLKKQVEDKVMFKQLMKLNLEYIDIDDDTFKGIITSCSLIENLRVMYCGGLKRIKVTRLYNLKEFSVGPLPNQRVEIEAPNLRCLDCPLVLGSFYLYKTEKVKYLALGGRLTSATFLDNLGHKFPQVEHLKLTYLDPRDKIYISSHSVKRISLEYSHKLRAINIDAPNIVSLELKNITFFPDLSLTSEFYELIQLLEEVFQDKISLLLCSSEDTCRLVKYQHYQRPVFEVEKLHLDFRFSRPLAHSNILDLDALFPTCHPKAIIVPWSRDPVVFTYNYLIERRRHETISWYQGLKEVKLEAYDGTKHQWQPIDGKNLPVAPQDWSEVCFRLEWEAV